MCQRQYVQHICRAAITGTISLTPYLCLIWFASDKIYIIQRVFIVCCSFSSPPTPKYIQYILENRPHVLSSVFRRCRTEIRSHYLQFVIPRIKFDNLRYICKLLKRFAIFYIPQWLMVLSNEKLILKF